MKLRHLRHFSLRDFLATRVLPPPVEAGQWRYSMLYSTWDDPVKPNGRLLETALQAIAAAPSIDLAALGKRVRTARAFPEEWPGEHYKLLAAFMKVLKPKRVVEIGTGTGLSALAMKSHMPRGSTLSTFDLTPWQEVKGGILAKRDFADGRLVQFHDDVTRPEGLETHRRLLEGADFLFVDAAKDGEMEARLLAGFEGLRFRRRPLVCFDDIRLMTMLALWRDIRRPKLDLTSFGHWTGTGLVDWS